MSLGKQLPPNPYLPSCPGTSKWECPTLPSRIKPSIASSQITPLLSAINLSFSNSSYKLTDIFDLKGWIEYITRTGAKIITLSNE